MKFISCYLSHKVALLTIFKPCCTTHVHSIEAPWSEHTLPFRPIPLCVQQPILIQSTPDTTNW